MLLQGFGHPDCPEFYLAVEAMEGVAQVLRQAMARTGYAADGIGQVEKSWTHRREDKVWQWKVRVLMPSSITASALELAKHMAERNEFIEPICLVPVRGYTVH